MIVDHLMEMDKFGFPLTQDQLRKSACEIAADHGITLQASNKWISLFLKRHLDLPHQTSQSSYWANKDWGYKCAELLGVVCDFEEVLQFHFGDE